MPRHQAKKAKKQHRTERVTGVCTKGRKGPRRECERKQKAYHTTHQSKTQRDLVTERCCEIGRKKGTWPVCEQESVGVGANKARHATTPSKDTKERSILYHCTQAWTHKAFGVSFTTLLPFCFPWLMVPLPPCVFCASLRGWAPRPWVNRWDGSRNLPLMQHLEVLLVLTAFLGPRVAACAWHG